MLTVIVMSTRADLPLLNYLGLLWSFSRKVEYILFLTKVLDNNLETVWPGKVKQKNKLYVLLQENLSTPTTQSVGFTDLNQRQ